MNSGIRVVDFLVLLAAVVLRVASPSTADLSYLLIAGYALFGRERAVRALALSWLLTMLNPGIAPEAPLASIDRYLVLAMAALSVISRSRLEGHRLWSGAVTKVTILVGGFILIHSMLASAFTDISMLKILSWMVALVTLLVAWKELSIHKRNQLAKELFAGLSLVMIASLPLLESPIGYLRNGTGFQGILNHPQPFGLVMGIIGAHAAIRLLSSPRPKWRVILTFGISGAMVVLSEARTAGLAMVAGVALAAAMGPILTRQPLQKILPGLFSRRLLVVFTIALASSMFWVGPFLAHFDTYLGKGAESGGGLVDVYNDSRGYLMQKSWANIEASPISGIGFGISSDFADMTVERDSTFGLPTGAPTEKGVLPVAVLEEIGIPGFILFFLWVSVVVIRSARNGGIEALTVALTVLLTNLGEATLFSAGGMGLLMLILISWSAADYRHKAFAGVRDA